MRGLGISSDGKGKSLWAPRKEGQMEAIKRAYRCGVDMSTIQYIEAHATATQVGDATELNTIGEFLGGCLEPGHKIPIGGVKANIGHTLESAGVAGVIKTVLAMQNKTVPPAINVNRLNPKIPWDDVPVYVPMEATRWDPPADGQPRRAGVNAFGIGGLNMHIVLEQFDESTRAERSSSLPQLRPRTADEKAIAIVGMGCILPGALNVSEYWDLLVSGRDPKTRVPRDRWDAALLCRADSSNALAGADPVGGFITNFEYDWRKHKVPPKQVAQADPLQFMLLEAADQAMTDAGYDKKDFDRTRCGVLVGSEFGGDFAFQLQLGLRLPELERHIARILADRGMAQDQAQQIADNYSEALLKQWPALIDETGSFTASSLASRISKTWNLMGGATAIDSGSASAMSALTISVDALLAGDADMMICTAGQQRMGQPQFEAMAVNEVLADPNNLRSPLDAASNGYVPGEGVGCVVLKRLADARRDGDKIRGVIRGLAAVHSDNWQEAVQTAAERALADAGVSPADVRMAELDTTLMRHTDEQQFRAMRTVYGQEPRKQPLLLGSVTAQIGHTEGASGMASMIKTCLETENRQAVGTFGMQAPTPTIAEAAPALQCTMQSEPLNSVPEEQPLAAVSSTTRKLAYHVIIQRGAPTVTESPQQATEPAAVPAKEPANWKIYHVGASTPEQLAQRLASAGSGTTSDLAGLANGEFKKRDAVRLAVVADGPATLTQRLRLAQKLADKPSAWLSLENQGVYCRQIGSSRPRIAFMFSGQGSQYPGMLQQLVEQEPVAAKALAECDAALTRLGQRTFAEMMWQDTPIGNTDVWTPQASMLVADYIMYNVLAERGIRPDLMAGHSYGEYAALLAAGAWDLETALRVTLARCDAIEQASALGGMLATTAPIEVVEKMATHITPRVYVANHNAPDQVVVGGPREALSQLDAQLLKQSYQSQILQVPCPFHTPWMKDAAAPLAQALASVDFRAPQIALWSCANNRLVSGADDIRSNLVAHMTSPVRYVDLVQSIAAEQPTVFVEVGPHHVLTRLHQRILDGSDAATVASDSSKRSADEQLLSVQALLESVGAWGNEHKMADQISKTQTTAASVGRGEILTFDATARRRDKMRQASGSTGSSAPAAAASTPAPSVATPIKVSQTIATSRIGKPAVQHAVAPTSNGASTHASGFDAGASYAGASAHASSNGDNGHASAANSPLENGRSTGHDVHQRVAAPTEKKQDTAALETFLINFVVEQTGYPAEVVELDADLEADLGIDSIKKAQLFGELQEYFDVTPSDDLSLDDFPTLRHVMEFLADIEPKTDLGVGTTTDTESVATEPVAAESKPNQQASIAPSAATAAPDTANLEEFLINFVVEQTGYPAEVVELDADLEADLGIDSIKKAQLFGELQEYFDVTPTDDLSLDDFPTLRHVMEFLADIEPKTDLGVGTTTTANSVASEPTVQSGPAEQAAKAPPAATTAADTANLEEFLINFVVEQTGYPADVVELDADLEADLGIDSIKKAQLFGELQEYFDVTPSEDLTLDDFPTLRHVMDFLSNIEPKTDLGVADNTAPPAPVAAAPAAAVQPETTAQPAPAATTSTPAPATADLEAFLINFVVEQTGYPEDVVELDADLEADLGIDSIKKAQLFGELQEYFDVTPSEDLTLDDFPTLRHVMDFLADIQPKADLGVSSSVAEPSAAEAIASSAYVDPAPAAAAVSAAPATAELEAFLINFVVEQTGYPEDVVELDADLEADLGIDSIKKAQLFGELQEFFDVTPSEDLTLDDFPTLRHVMDFLADAPRKGALADVAETATIAEPTPAPAETSRVGVAPSPSPTVAVATATRPRSSEAYDFGREYAVKNRAKIREELRHFADLPDAARPHIPQLSNGHVDLDALFDAVERDRLQGIADAVEMPLGNIVALRLRSGDAASPLDPLAIAPPKSEAETDVAPHAPDIAELEMTDAMSNRYVIRMIEVAIPDELRDTRVMTGSALVVGDNPDANALKEQLTQRGVNVRTFVASSDLDETLQAFERLWQAEPISHLFLTSARDRNVPSAYDDAGWHQRQYDGTLVPFFLAQRWLQLAEEAKMLDQCSLVGLASLGGDTGLTGRINTVDSAAISALIKSLYIEFHILQELKNFKVVSIDAPADEPSDQLARNVVNEVASGAADYEVAYVGDSRRLQNGVERSVTVQPEADVRPGGVWVVTGGARGITAACALALGRRFNLRLHLIGTSPEPDVDNAWRNLSEDETKKLRANIMAQANQRGENMEDAWRRVEKAIEIDRCLSAYQDANVRATYHQCDVADQSQLAVVLESIRATDGPIEGVIHGAGVDVSCRFQKKQRDIVQTTIGAKANGARNLIALTREDPVGHFIGFGSISGRFGSNGQADYCVASDLLAKVISWYRTERPSCRAACFHWHPWDEVGMATRPAALAALKAGLAPELMPLAEGVQHFLREIHAGVPDREVLITNNEYFRRYYGEGSEQIPDAPPLPEPGAVARDEAIAATEKVTKRLVVKMCDAPLPD
ncbi:MAG: SDR family NAD(P)-dependent oxidoreductase, partial [Pirellulales bacterium]|nr:SDR family NAD(P)-dependent oxidoreductase [Pirellulales bacterium]